MMDKLIYHVLIFQEERVEPFRAMFSCLFVTNCRIVMNESENSMKSLLLSDCISKLTIDDLLKGSSF